MELFKLFGTIAVENDEANRAIDETTGRAEKSRGKFSSAFSKIGSAAVKGTAAVVGGLAGATGALVAFGKSQEQEVENMGKLETAFVSAGGTIEQAHDTYANFMGLVGDSDQATEAAQDMANLAEVGGDLDSWYTIAAGAMARFGDALPTENLIEAANETARTGTVVGGMADALNWAGTSADTWANALGVGSEAQIAFTDAINEGLPVEDAMNAALATTSDATERQTMLQNALTAVYSEAGAAYQENNANLIASCEAQGEFNAKLAEAAEAAMPVTTALTNIGTTVLTFVLPYLQQFANWITENLPTIQEKFQTFSNEAKPLLTAIGDAAKFIYDNLDKIAPIVGIVVGAFATVSTVTAIVQGVTTAMSAWKTITTAVNTATTILNATLRANPIMAVVSVIAMIVAAIVTWLTTTDEGREAWQKFCDKMREIWNNITGFFSGAIEKISGFLNDLKSGWEETWGNIESFFENVWQNIQSFFEDPFGTLRNAVTNIISWVKSNFKLPEIKFPSIKLPHFSISGSFSLNPLSVPHLGIEWYAKGGVFDQPTILNSDTGLKGVGEAGPEAVTPVDVLLDYVRTAVAEQNAGLGQKLDRLADLLAQFFPQILTGLERPMVMDTGALVGAIAPTMDRKFGDFNARRERGN